MKDIEIFNNVAGKTFTFYKFSWMSSFYVLITRDYVYSIMKEHMTGELDEKKDPFEVEFKNHLRIDDADQILSDDEDPVEAFKTYLKRNNMDIAVYAAEITDNPELWKDEDENCVLHYKTAMDCRDRVQINTIRGLPLP